ncbi:LytTR family DNA-binding domain-containing protein [Paenibacillus paeoniae]|nr:LytTR family DNA-binding domain-containing protein [Paenibacillus paeoniae]
MYSDRLLKMLKEDISSISFHHKNEMVEIISNSVRESGILFLPQEKNSMRLLDPEDILYVTELKRGKVNIHTLTSEIPFNNSAYNLLEYLVEKNKSFCYLNRGYVVNQAKIMKFNSYFRRIYFANDREVTVTGEAIKILIKALGKEKDVHNESYIGKFEY